MSGKKILLGIFIVLLLIGIPASIFLVRQQTVFTPKAEKSTTISFEPISSSANPIVKTVGDNVVLDIMVDPGVNVVTSINVEIQYDPDRLATSSAADAFVINNSIFSAALTPPTFSPGKISANLAIGDPTKALMTKTKAGTITFKALATTAANTPTQITFTANSRATSRGSTDQALENVLSTTIPAFITINAGAQPTNTPTQTPAPTTAAPTGAPTATPTPPSGANTTDNNAVPECQALTVDQSSGPAPLAVNLTANGNDTDGTVTKATFNFGDGQVSDVTTGGGIGTQNVNVPIGHTYATAGTFQATALLTDDSSGVSTTTNCTQTITVAGNGTSTPAPTVAPTGSTAATIGFGIVTMLFIIGGGLLFLVL